MGRFARIGPRIAVVVLIVVGAVFAIAMLRRGIIDPAAIRTLIAGSAFAPLIFVALQIAASLLFVPRTFLGIAAGLLFGFGWGSFWAMAGAIAGAAAGFALWRWLKTGQIDIEATPKLGPLILKAEQGGWRSVAIVRLIPGIPHSVANTALALTRIGWTEYLIGSSLGMLPMTLVQVDVGATGGSLLTGGNWVLGSLALAGLLAVSFLLKRAAVRRA